MVPSGGVSRKSHLLLLRAEDDVELKLTSTDAINLTMVGIFDGLSADEQFSKKR